MTDTTMPPSSSVRLSKPPTSTRPRSGSTRLASPPGRRSASAAWACGAGTWAIAGTASVNSSAIASSALALARSNNTVMTLVSLASSRLARDPTGQRHAARQKNPDAFLHGDVREERALARKKDDVTQVQVVGRHIHRHQRFASHSPIHGEFL